MKSFLIGSTTNKEKIEFIKGSGNLRIKSSFQQGWNSSQIFKDRLHVFRGGYCLQFNSGAHLTWQIQGYC